MKVIIGLGCDRNTPLETLETAINLALATIGLERSSILSLATIDKKNDEQSLLELSTIRDWPLIFYSAIELSKVTVPNPSQVVQKYMGTPAVSEAAALLAANTDINDLIVEKFKYRGTDGKNATVSIVRLKGPE
jgi:cobalt-precorrin 5A hydrolase